MQSANGGSIMFRLLLLIVTASIFSFSAATAAATKPATEQVKQLDLAYKIVDVLGFGEGLPEKPLEKDYLEILGGSRTFKFEAEDTFDLQSDPVSVRNYPLFGAFSGKGWLHGTTTQTAIHFKVFIPVAGKYTLRIAAKGDDQLWSVAGKAFKLNFGSKLTESRVEQLFIPAGVLEFNAVIPPAGAIDYLVFSAPAYAPVEPLAGWSPAAPLTADAVNEVIASLLGLEPLLPEDQSFRPRIIEAASLPGLPETVQKTDNRILGKPSAEKWVRAFQAKATVSVPLEMESSSVYRVRVRAVGTQLTAGFGQRTVTVPLKPYLDWVDLGTFRLAKGMNTLELQLPPTGGVDLIEVSRKLVSAADYAAVTKSAKAGKVPLKPEELDEIVKSLQGQFKERK